MSTASSQTKPQNADGWLTDAEWEAELRRPYPRWARLFLVRELPAWILRSTDAMARVFPERKYPNATLPHPFVLWLRGLWWRLVGRIDRLGPKCPHGCGCTRWTCQAMYANFEDSCSCLDYGGDS